MRKRPVLLDHRLYAWLAPEELEEGVIVDSEEGIVIVLRAQALRSDGLLSLRYALLGLSRTATRGLCSMSPTLQLEGNVIARGR